MANKKNSIKDNTGATENQVIILTDRIRVINTHLKINKNDAFAEHSIVFQQDLIEFAH